MAKVVSLINLKGGVGKTTTTIQLAECLASEFNKKVLVIDLDPQTNATIALIDEENWEKLDKNGKTLFHLFNDKLEKSNNFDISKAIQNNVSNLNLNNLSLLASSIRFIDIQDRINDIPAKVGYSINPMEVLKTAISSRLDDYDYILIDCPPNLGFITRNGIEISDYYLIPTIPDTLSTYGIPQIVKKIDEYRSERSLKIRCLGLLITKFSSNSSTHIRGLKTLPARFSRIIEEVGGESEAHVFETKIPQANVIAESMEYNENPRTFKKKYGYSYSGGKKLYTHVIDLTKEFIKNVEQQ